MSVDSLVKRIQLYVILDAVIVVLWFQRLPPARGGTAQKKIIHLATHPSRTSVKSDQGFFGVE